MPKQLQTAVVNRCKANVGINIHQRDTIYYNMKVFVLKNWQTV